MATAAVRQAVNRDALIDAVRGSCGLEVRVLSAQEEARMAAAESLKATHGVGSNVQDMLQAMEDRIMRGMKGMLQGGEDMVSLYLVQREERLWIFGVTPPIFCSICFIDLYAIRSGVNRH